MRALVTGAAGFIGHRLAARLIDLGHEVVALDSLTPYYDVAIKRARFTQLGASQQVQLVAADLNDADLGPILDGCDTVFHFAAQPGVRASWTTFDQYVAENVLATQRLLASIEPAGVQRFVYASSSSVYGQKTGTVDETAATRPFSPYGVTKLAAESLCDAYAQNFGLPVVSLRLFTVYGPGQRPDMAMHRLIRSSLTGESFPMFGDGAQVRSFTFVDDVVEAAIATTDHDLEPGTVANISGGTTCTLKHVIDTVEEITGQPVPIDRRDVEAGDVTRTDADIGRASRLLDWLPQTDLHTGLTRQVASMRDHLDSSIASA